MITTNEYQEQQKTTMRRTCNFKNLISDFDINVFLRVVWILSQLRAFALELQQKNLRGQKCIVWKNALVPQYFLICYFQQV